MRNILVLTLLVWCAAESDAQGIYPLQVGNLWQLEDSDPMIYYMIESRVQGEMVMPNGHTYNVISGFGAGSGASHVRQVRSVVYAYNFFDSTEYALYNFGATVGDTISIRFQPYRSIVLLARDSVSFYGRRLTRWVFHEEGPAWFATHYVIDSVGLSYIWMEPGIAFYLQGAIINGIQYGTIVSVKPHNPELPQTPLLRQNYPNPFNPSTTIQYELPEEAFVTLRIFNMLGQELATLVNEENGAGSYQVQFDGTGLASGVYFYRLRAGEFVETKKLILAK